MKTVRFVEIDAGKFVNPEHVCAILDSRDCDGSYYVRVKTTNGDEFRLHHSQNAGELAKKLSGAKCHAQSEIDIEEIRGLMKRVEELVMAIGSDGVGVLPDSVIAMAANLQIALTKVIVALPKEESVKNGNNNNS